MQISLLLRVEEGSNCYVIILPEADQGTENGRLRWIMGSKVSVPRIDAATPRDIERSTALKRFCDDKAISSGIAATSMLFKVGLDRTRTINDDVEMFKRMMWMPKT